MQMLPSFSRSLPRPVSRLRTLCAPSPHRNYCFESGRNRKPERSNKPPSTNDTEASPDPKPATGHGRRHRTSSISQSAQKSARPPSPGLRLPFVPLPSDHLDHLRPKLLSLDQFFSLQRPLLEIEIPLSERRSITAESLFDSPEPDLLEPAPELITTGSPSDPAFKPPQASTGGVFTDPTNEEIDDELWGAVDGYAPYLIAEPDGVDPAWPRALKHYLASASAFVPPPVPTPQEPTETPAVDVQTEHDRRSLADRDRVEKRRLQDVQFLAPFGTFTASSLEPSDDTTEPINSNVMAEENPLPEISQDPQSLTLQAARFLHAGLTSFRWPSVVQWDGVREELAAAEAAHEGQEQEQGSEDAGDMGPVRGTEPNKHLSRESSHWVKLTIEPAKGEQQTILVNSSQVMRIVNNILAHKSRPRNGIKRQDFKVTFRDAHDWDLDEKYGPIQMDSVQRKRKRKMKVHKYKKRRKARRVLRKRQGRD